MFCVCIHERESDEILALTRYRGEFLLISLTNGIQLMLSL